MTPDELFRLPIGTRLRDNELQLDGEVVTRVGGMLHIRWSDGDVTKVAPDDDDLGEFAGSLEVVAGPASDEPLIAGGP
jgi:hypothetical protein